MEPRTLPPISATEEMYYNLLVYYHIIYWKGKGANMKHAEWGLHIVDGKWIVIPTQTDKPAEPT